MLDMTLKQSVEADATIYEAVIPNPTSIHPARMMLLLFHEKPDRKGNQLS